MITQLVNSWPIFPATEPVVTIHLWACAGAGVTGFKRSKEVFRSLNAKRPRGSAQSMSNVTKPMIAALEANPTSELLTTANFLNKRQAAIAVATAQTNGANKR